MARGHRPRRWSVIRLDHLRVLFGLGTVGSLTDGELIDRFLSGGEGVAEAAFTALVDRHGALVLHACREVLGNSEDASDAFQATFLVLLKRAESIRDRGSVASWLYGVALRVSSRSRAESARRRLLERKGGERPTVMDTPEDAEARSEGWRELHEEIARLPDRFREPIILHYFEGLSAEAAAERLGCARGTILSRLARGRERLRGRLLRRGLSPAVATLPASMPFVLPTVPASLAGATAHAAAGAKTATTGAFSAQITSLAEGVLRTMMIKKLAVFVAACLIGGGLAVGGANLLAEGQAPATEKTVAKTKPVAKAKAEPARSDLANERLGQFANMLATPGVDSLRSGLGITKAQLEVIKKLADERQPKQTLAYKGLPLFIGFEQKQKMAEEMTANIDRDAGKTMAALLRPAQLARLDQIVLTAHGVRAFQYADVREKLRLEPEQTAKLDAILVDWRENLRGFQLRPGGPKDTAEALDVDARAAVVYKKALDKAIAVLTPEQKAIWQGLVGKPFVAGETPPE